VFRFSNNPAAVSVSDGIQDAFQYLQISWRRWLPIVGAIAACTFVMYTLIGSIDSRAFYYVDRYTGRIVWSPDALNRLSPVIAAGVVGMLLSVIGSMVFYATAIAGLRNRPLTAGYVVGRGLLMIVAGLLVGLAAAGAILLLAIMFVITPLLGILAILAAIPVGFYLVIRIIFMGLAIFDGFGPIEGLQESWRLSQGSVLRLFGWGVMAGLISIGISIIAGVIVAPFSTSGLAPLAQAASTAVTVAGSCLVTFMMAVLYESERARKDPSLYPYPAWPGYGPYGPQPYAPGPYPANPTAMPGWVSPNGPYPAGPYAPGPYPANPTAMPGWVTPGPAPAWAANEAQPAALDSAGPGPTPPQTWNSGETDPTQQPPNAPKPPEPPAS